MSKLILKEFAGLYDPVELAILCDWLGRTRPDELADIDLTATMQIELKQAGPVRLLQADYTDHETALANAVARIALNAIADRLPQWMASKTSGEVVFGRKHQPRRGLTVDPLPRFLLTINWADSGPGYSWPESYHATFLPGLDCFVVTLSADSPEVYGYTDLALGHFPTSADFDNEVERIICEFWTDHTDADPDRAWKEVWGEGLISAGSAYYWREQIWWVDEDGYPMGEDEPDEDV